MCCVIEVTLLREKADKRCKRAENLLINEKIFDLGEILLKKATRNLKKMSFPENFPNSVPNKKHIKKECKISKNKFFRRNLMFLSNF